MHDEIDVIYVNGSPELRNRPEPAVELYYFLGFCGCGEPAKYSLHTGDMSCNKYSRCSPRSAGSAALEKSNKAINRIAQIARHDMHPADKTSMIRALIDGLSGR